MDGVELLKMPNIEDVMSGELEVNQLKKVEVEDLLGRDPVELDMDMISNELTNKTILVTGAGGSIGSEFVDKFVISIQNVLFYLAMVKTVFI